MWFSFGEPLNEIEVRCWVVGRVRASEDLKCALAGREIEGRYMDGETRIP